MYLLYVDESGSHTSMDNQAYVLGGVAIHEHDVNRLGSDLHRIVQDALSPAQRAEDYELHAAELRDPDHDSRWAAIDGTVRRGVLDTAIAAVADFTEASPERPMRLFTQVLPAGRRKEHEAYGRLMNRFDDWLAPFGEQGMVLSDVCKRDRDIQRWADEWRAAAGPWGRLERLAEVPLFADSRSSRLLQAADLVAWSSWRRFGIERYDDRWWKVIEPRVELELHRD